MYKPVLLNADAIGMPHLSGSQLHCHAGVVTATNFILSDLERHKAWGWLVVRKLNSFDP